MCFCYAEKENILKIKGTIIWNNQIESRTEDMV